MKITVDLNDEQIAFLLRALDWPEEKRDELAQAWLLLADEAWVSWLSGGKRYTSLSEQYTDWIEKIYNRFLPDDPPSVDRLSNSFNVPYGQAQYMARVLKERNTAEWRDKALTELKERLSEKEKKITSEEWRDVDKADINMSKSAAIQLERIIWDLYRQSPEDVDIPSRSGWGDLTAVKITVGTLKKVCEHLRKKKEE
jgi:hypothetical protein